MAEGINVRIPTEAMQEFIKEKTGPQGLYGSASEYVRELIRRDYALDEQRRWDRFNRELRPALDADPEQYVPFDAEEIIAIAKKESAAPKKE